MKKIIGFKEETRYPENTKICSKCNCIFMYDETDVEHETESGVDYFGAWWTASYWVKCPNCGKDICIKTENGGR